MKISIALLAIASLVAAQDYGWSSVSSSSAAASSSAGASGSASSASGSASSASGAASSSASAAPSNTGHAASPSASSTGTNSGGSSAQTVPTVNIPTSISSACSSFLTNLNTASSLQSCLSPLISALSSSSVSSFCSSVQAGGACGASSMRAWLTYFKGNCSDEVSNNNDVQSMYDTLYVTSPFVNAMCTKDANGNYCVSGSSTSGASNSGSSQTPLMGSNGMPDANAFSSNDILFLGANPKMTATELCTTCTQKVLNAYFSFESNTPYASTISQSPLLSSQNDLYAAIQKTCPVGFLSSALGNVGGGPNSVNGALTMASFEPVKLVSAVMAVAAGFMAL